MRKKTVLLLALCVLLLDLPLLAAVKNPPLRAGNRSLQKQRKLKKARHLRSSGRRWRLRRIFIPWSPVKGSRESLLRQNERTDDLERIQDDEQLFELTQAGSLIELPSDRTVGVAGNLPEDRRYCRPWTRTFVQDFARDYFDQFHQPLTVTSAVRTVAVQKKLRRHNRNAAEIEGDAASPHLTGATIDIGKRGMTKAQLKWCREYLLEQQNRGSLDVEEEFRQRVFHITVYRDYDLETVRDASAPEAEAPAPDVGLDPASAPAVLAPAASPDLEDNGPSQPR
ncbi:MAG: hypothetical protein HYX28_04920 [Candidatus Koribacter versatilis]|uniref:Peptidase M15A C-terminal domain-containing protein n=1 Tax=Candidatus Korobacter versatilis TaxID=658062 RepID=A0A932A7H0_9BACT|nr:hypothetical protein [Candidatus Koribacter versatilis]